MTRRGRRSGHASHPPSDRALDWACPSGPRRLAWEGRPRLGAGMWSALRRWAAVPGGLVVLVALVVSGIAALVWQHGVAPRHGTGSGAHDVHHPVGHESMSV